MHRARFAREVSEDRLDHCRIFDARDDAHRAAAARAGLNVDAEPALQALCPAHRGAPLGRRSRLGPGRTCPALAPPGLGDQCAVRTVGCEHTVVASEVHPWAGHQRGQPRQKIQRLRSASPRQESAGVDQSSPIGFPPDGHLHELSVVSSGQLRVTQPFRGQSRSKKAIEPVRTPRQRGLVLRQRFFGSIQFHEHVPE